MTKVKCLSELIVKGKLYPVGAELDIPSDSVGSLLELSAIAILGESEAPDVINLNQASASELIALPGVGPATAQKLINARPIETVESAQEIAEMNTTAWNEIVHRITV